MIEGDWPGRFWHRLEDGRIQCDLCPRLCKLRDGQRGMCFVRANRNSGMVLTTYGRSSGFCIDPIEKKPLNHFLPGTPILSFGTAGCNLTCKFCQNWDISKSKEMDRLMDQASPGTIARAAKSLGCRSVAFTYNDPVIFHEYAVDVAQACREVGIHTVAVTAGYVCPEPREEFYQHMDAANIDLKAFSETFYRRLAAGHLEPVKDTLRYVCNETDVWVELTTLIIPEWNDSEAELRGMAEWVVEALGPDVPMHFTAFHPDWKLRDVPSTPPETLTRARKIALETGIRFAYTGNVHDKAGGSTFCPECGDLLVGRAWYVLSEWNMNEDSRCEGCGTPVPGVFEAHPGTWGGRREPVRLSDFR
ncbi:MAG: AmmeMemoRadiSam system radical SAM enzyme [Gemmatimonadetes bacterium]|nr:AmmeMemoRadiSam system radical SAM enzyme [Gemmatimonadota bacterium]NNM07125.1 AmmeMemoRadiSam system radical SAM enzyme [Gemmatimonadota bacterium]